MSHVHSHSHAHYHHHDGGSLTNISTTFVLGISLNLLFVIIEVIAGLYIHSLSLLSDAGHNLADVASLGLSLFAFKMLKVKPSENYTFGYRKTSVLVSLFNAVVLLLSLGAIAFEAIFHIIHPVALPGITISIVAGIGIVINSVTALLFFRDKEKDINIKSAYLHLLSDAVVSFGLVIGGIIIKYTQWFWLDGSLSLIIAIFILVATWRLLKTSLRLSLDGVPDNTSLDDVKATVLQVRGIENIHHIHVWAISTTENALTAHILIKEDTGYEEEEKIKAELRHQLLHKNIHHVTLEVERKVVADVDEPCLK